MTDGEIYELAKTQLIMDYNYQRKQVKSMTRKANADIEHATQYNKLACVFNGKADETFEKIMYLTTLIEKENNMDKLKTCPFCGGRVFNNSKAERRKEKII